MHKLSKFILVFGLFILIAAIGIHFIFQQRLELSEVDYPPSGEGDCYLATTSLCTDYTDDWKTGLPEGKLVVIIPKIYNVGKQFQIVGFAYSPTIYSTNQITEITQQFIHDMNINENEVHVASLNIFMDIEGEPVFLADPSGLNIHGEPQYTALDEVTVWHMTSNNDDHVVEGFYNIDIQFRYPEQNLYSLCIQKCKLKSGEFSEEPSVNVEIQIKHTLRSWIKYNWAELKIRWDQITKWLNDYWITQSILFYLALVFVVYLIDKRITKKNNPL